MHAFPGLQHLRAVLRKPKKKLSQLTHVQTSDKQCAETENSLDNRMKQMEIREGDGDERNWTGRGGGISEANLLHGILGETIGKGNEVSATARAINDNHRNFSFDGLMNGLHGADSSFHHDQH